MWITRSCTLPLPSDLTDPIFSTALNSQLFYGPKQGEKTEEQCYGNHKKVILPVAKAPLVQWVIESDHACYFAVSYCSWGSQGKNAEGVCHSLLQCLKN